MHTFDVEAYQLCFRLPPKLAGLLKALVETDRMTGHAIEGDDLAFRAPNAMQKLRPRLEKYGIVIQSQKGIGYWIDPEMKGHILKLLTEYTGGAERVLEGHDG